MLTFIFTMAFSIGSSAWAQTVCPRCGQIHGPKNSVTVSSPVSQPIAGGVQNVLSTLNAQRARQGVGSLAFDAQLQAVAQQRAQTMAAMGLKSHPPGSYAPGRYEGVGWSSSFQPGAVQACYTSDPSMKAAGAAMATGADGVYFAVVYR